MQKQKITFQKFGKRPLFDISEYAFKFDYFEWNFGKATKKNVWKL